MPFKGSATGLGVNNTAGSSGLLVEHTAETFLLLKQTLPLVDVRSPGEFCKAHIPGAVNLPLFDDAERARVGTLYKNVGKQEALLAGMEYAGPKLALLTETIFDVCGENSREIAMYCWRGGLRSHCLAWLFGLAGIRVHLLQGGYKAFRQYTQGIFVRPWFLRVLGGRTGAGKTEALLALKAMGGQIIDLEGLAKHRGSAFGAFAGEEQPGCEHFENALALSLVRLDPTRPVWVENESENLGTVNIPRAFLQQMRSAPFYNMHTPEDQRLDRVLGEYSHQPVENIGCALDRIKKRLGGLAHSQAQEALSARDFTALASILLAYYDRLYDRQVENRPPTATIRANSPAQAASQMWSEDQRGLQVIPIRV